MAEIEQTFEERLISGTGILVLPDAAKKARYLRLYFDVKRDPESNYLNLAYEPPRGRFANISVMRGVHVMQTFPVEYKSQMVAFYGDPAGQALVAVQCMYEGVLQTFVNLGLALSLIPISVENKIAEFENVNPLPDRIIVKCYGSAAVRLVLKGKKYDKCDPSDDEPVEEPPVPPPPIEPVPPGTPLDVSPPYDPDDLAEPFDPDPLDVPEDPPDPFPTEPCLSYTVTVQIRAADPNDPFANAIADTRVFLGVIAPFRLSPVSSAANPTNNVSFQQSSCTNGVVTGEYIFTAGVSGGSVLRFGEIVAVVPT